jgi:hypothetical protein
MTAVIIILLSAIYLTVDRKSATRAIEEGAYDAFANNNVKSPKCWIRWMAIMAIIAASGTLVL